MPVLRRDISFRLSSEHGAARHRYHGRRRVGTGIGQHTGLGPAEGCFLVAQEELGRPGQPRGSLHIGVRSR